MTAFDHISVLHSELCLALKLTPGDKAIDCTAGGGGHTARMLELVGSSGQVLAIDRDPVAIRQLRQRFATPLADHQLVLAEASFSQLASLAGAQAWAGQVQGIAADLGVSSPQLDTPERGFSFMHDGPLDMRMSPSDKLTAADIVNTYEVNELTTIFREYGEEPQAYHLAKALVKHRQTHPFTTTKELADFISAALPYAKKSKKHPATKVFQALRICVNDELNEISSMLTAAFQLLRPGGRLAVISFHSLEDRIVKNFCREQAGTQRRQDLPRGVPFTAAEVARLSAARGQIIKPFPLVPSADEEARNRRARSAKLRVIEKLVLDP